MIYVVEKKQLLVVCTGNTCRSPMAEGILRHKAQEERISHLITVHSAGICAEVGAGASLLALEMLLRHGIQLPKHKAKQLSEGDVVRASLILTMEEAHRTAVLRLSRNASDRVVLLNELPGRYGDIPDPYGGDLKDYSACFAQIDQCLQRGWTDILTFMQIGGDPTCTCSSQEDRGSQVDSRGAHADVIGWAA